MKLRLGLILFLSARMLGAQQTDTLFTARIGLSNENHSYYEQWHPDSLAGSGSPVISGLLQTSPTLDLRGGGAGVGFADLSIRGGTFNQAAVFINGLPTGNPQTGHHLLQLPIDPTALGTVRVIDGSIGFAGYGNTYAGAVNLMTRNDGPSDFTVEAGQYGLLHTALNFRGKQGQNGRLLISQYYTRSDGYLTGTDVNNTDLLSYGQFGVYTGRIASHIQLLVQGGWQHKNFGANRLYSPYFPWQYERIRNAHAGLRLTYDRHWKTGLMLAANGLKDRFELFREDRYTYHDGYYIHDADTAAYVPGAYYRGPNIHLSGDFSAALFTRGTILRGGKPLFALRLKVMRRFQSIYGNKLGGTGRDSIYLPAERLWLDHSARRVTDLWTLGLREMFWKGGRGEAAISVLRYGNHYYPLGGIRLQKPLSAATLLMLRAGSGFRLPTFTELYYNGPTNHGNPDLQPERNWEAEMGMLGHNGQWQWKISVFYRYEQASIDWIRYPTDTHWHAENLCSRSMAGFRGQVSLHSASPWLSRVQLSYQYLTDNRPAVRFDSKYALNYLRHYAVFSVAQQPSDKIRLLWTARFKSRRGNYAVLSDSGLRYMPYKPFVLLDLNAEYRPANALHLFVRASNLTDVRAYDLAFVPMPGRWISAGVQVFFP